MLTYQDVRNMVTRLADGEDVPAVYGSDRAFVVETLVSILRSIKPTEGEIIEHAFNGWNKRKIAAYRSGVAHLKDAYNTVAADLPAF